MKKPIKMRESIDQSSMVEAICFVVALLCTILVVMDIVKLNFTPITAILDIFILIIDIRFIVKFIKRKRDNR